MAGTARLKIAFFDNLIIHMEPGGLKCDYGYDEMDKVVARIDSFFEAGGVQVEIWAPDGYAEVTRDTYFFGKSYFDDIKLFVCKTIPLEGEVIRTTQEVA